MSISRRDLLKLSIGACALGTAGAQGLAAFAAAKAKKIPIGLQLYSVRNECAKDLPGVLKAVAQMGYQGVEFAGYHGRKAAELRKLLDDNGLVCCGTHTGLNTLEGAAFEATIEFNKTLGNKYLVVPGLAHKYFESVDAVKKTAALFTELAAKAKPAGMHVGYHAHGGDFQKVNGQTTWDIFYTNAGPAVIMQMDLGNCLGGGGDPYALLKKFPGRSLTIHLKEHGGKPGAAVGDGDVKWNEVFRLCETTGKTEWYIVEHESDPTDPMASIKLCLDNLRKMGK